MGDDDELATSASYPPIVSQLEHVRQLQEWTYSQEDDSDGLLDLAEYRRRL
mgnify:FL=1